MESTNHTNGGKPARIGIKFAEEIENIKIEKIKNNTSKEILSTEIITNLIIRHEDWIKLKKAIIKLTKEEINKHAK